MNKLTHLVIICAGMLCLGLLLAPQAQATCTAQWSCTDPYLPQTISCNGTSVCESGPYFVSCDGVRTDCIYCPGYGDCTDSCDTQYSYCVNILCDDPYMEMPPQCVWECMLERNFCYDMCEAPCS
jgi:hypothetical protein